jgi:hypothetical protein
MLGWVSTVQQASRKDTGLARGPPAAGTLSLCPLACIAQNGNQRCDGPWESEWSAVLCFASLTVHWLGCGDTWVL